MGLYIIYGINAAGKDTVALEVSKHFSNTIITSESRILMYHLGIVDSVDATKHVDREKYKQLENAKREDIQNIYKNDYPKTMRDLTVKYDLVLLLSHLVFACYLDKNRVDYIKDVDVPAWLVKLANGSIQLIADPEDILSRRLSDLKTSRRDRIVKIEQVEQHQQLCDEKWQKLKELYPDKPLVIIKNNNGGIKEATKDILNFIKSTNAK